MLYFDVSKMDSGTADYGRMTGPDQRTCLLSRDLCGRTLNGKAWYGYGYGGMRLKPNLFVGCDSNLMARQTALEMHNQALEDFSSCSCEPASSEHHTKEPRESFPSIWLGIRFSFPFLLRSERESSNQS